MDKEFVPMGNKEDGTQEEGFGGEDEESEDLDLSDEGQGRRSDMGSSWGSLPHVCLRHVFEFLPDCDRRSADLVCHHWHHVMRSPSLWRFRFFHFSGRLSKYRNSEHCSAVTYISSLGAYLQRLEVCVCPPSRSLTARRLEVAISGLLSELTRVKAPLQSLSLVKLELHRSCWTVGLRNSLVNGLINFLRRGSLKLNSVCLNGMGNSLNHGLELLSALTHSPRGRNSRCISSLDLKGFFSGAVHVYLNSSVPNTLHLLRGLTDLSLSYSCLSDELLTALQHRQRGQRWHCSRDGNTLQTFSLHCTLREPHRQVVSGHSWATLASNCPNLKVRLTVEQIITPSSLARILLPEIPLTEYTMTAFYAPDENWSAKPLLCDMLSRYRRSLQHLSLDLSNCSESLDEELLELVRVCERLEQLRIWAFLELSTVQRLLQLRLTQRNLGRLNKIKMRIYSVEDDTEEQEDQLEEILCSHLHLPSELEFYAIIYPYVDH